jgi:glycosyltransferase involved in cell wall biosynthesis
MINISKLLISHLPIPADWNGSYNVMFTNFIQKLPAFDYVISPYSEKSVLLSKNIKSVKFKHCVLVDRKRRIITGRSKWHFFLKEIEKILCQSEKLIIYNVDKVEITLEIDKLLKHVNRRKDAIIIHAWHHFALYGSQQFIRENLYSVADEIIFLSLESYVHEKTKSESFISEVSIIPNGIPLEYFSSQNIADFFEFDKYKDLKKFIWISHNRPKKGLHILLRAWEQFVKTNSGCILFLVGVDEIYQKVDSVECLGIKNQAEVAVLLKHCDYFIFSTLFQEGEPLILIEAFLGGCFIIYSGLSSGTNAAINRIDAPNKLIVDYPNIVQCWVETLEKSIEINFTNTGISKKNEALGLNEWIKKQSQVLKKWEDRFKE